MKTLTFNMWLLHYIIAVIALSGSAVYLSHYPGELIPCILLIGSIVYMFIVTEFNIEYKTKIEETVREQELIINNYQVGSELEDKELEDDLDLILNVLKYKPDEPVTRGDLSSILIIWTKKYR